MAKASKNAQNRPYLGPEPPLLTPTICTSSYIDFRFPIFALVLNLPSDTLKNVGH